MNYSLEISVVRKIFSTSKLHDTNICCILLSLIFFSFSILLEQITLLATRIVEALFSAAEGELRLSLAQNSQISLFLCKFSAFLISSSLSFVSCNHFHTDSPHLGSVAPSHDFSIVTVIPKRCPFHGRSRTGKEKTESKHNIPSGAEAIGTYIWPSWKARWKFAFISLSEPQIFPSS